MLYSSFFITFPHPSSQNRPGTQVRALQDRQAHKHASREGYSCVSTTQPVSSLTIYLLHVFTPDVTLLEDNVGSLHHSLVKSG